MKVLVFAQIFSDEQDLKLTGNLADTGQVLSFINAARFECDEKKNYRQAKLYADSAYKLSAKIPWKLGILLHWNTYGLISRAQSRYADAIEYHGFALELALELENEEQQVIALNNIATAYRRTDNYLSAIKYHVHALNVSDSAGLTESKMYALNGLGNSYLAVRNYDEALKSFNAAFDIARKTENIESQAINLNNIGDVCYQQQNYQEALYYYQESLAKNLILNSKEGIVISYISLGKAASMQEDYALAINYFEKSLAVDTISENKLYEATALIESGLAKLKLGEFSPAEFDLLKGLSLSVQIKSKQNTITAYRYLSEFYLFKNDFEKAYYYEHQFNLLKDSLISEEIQRNTHRLQVNFELDQKKKEIKTLTELNQNDQIRWWRRFLYTVIIGIILLGATIMFLVYRMIRSKNIANLQLRRLLNEKETLIAEVHHRVKNNLALIAGLIQLQSNNKENETESKALDEIYNRVYTFSLIYENLYDSGDFDRIDFKIFLKKYIQTIAAENQKSFIDVFLEIHDVHFQLRTAVPLALICNELVSNCYQHAFQGREGGEIHITLQSYEPKKWKLEIKDNGVGFRKNSKKNTTGFSIIDIYTQQLGAEYTFFSSIGYETIFQLLFTENA